MMKCCLRCAKLGREAWHAESAFARNAHNCRQCKSEQFKRWYREGVNATLVAEASAGNDRRAYYAAYNRAHGRIADDWPRPCPQCGAPLTRGQWGRMCQYGYCRACKPAR